MIKHQNRDDSDCERPGFFCIAAVISREFLPERVIL